MEAALEAIAKLTARALKTEAIHVIIDTPRGSRNKFKYDEELHLFKLSGVLPAGAVFPFDFGFIPATRGEDGDPLDALLLLDEPTFVGCLVQARLIGVIEAEQTEEDETVRNDRLIAVAEHSNNHRDVESINQLSGNLLEEIEHFFVSYNQAKGKTFAPRGRFGPDRAEKLLTAGIKLKQSKPSQKAKTKSKGKGAK
jgi:inorganic pyrophosphatase